MIIPISETTIITVEPCLIVVTFIMDRNEKSRRDYQLVR